MNNLSIVGRIGQVGALKYTGAGKAVTDFSVAVDNGKTPDGEKRQPTWFKVSLWEKQAENLHQYLTVGDRIGVTGQIDLRSYETKDGEKRTELIVNFPRVELLGNKPEAAQAAPRQAARPAQRQTAAVADYDPEVGF